MSSDDTTVENLNPEETMQRIDDALSHVWMVRAFLKHCDEAEDDDEVCEVHRVLYDYMLAVGGPFKENNPEAYLKQAKKKLPKLLKATELFIEIQPEVSSHTNFQMAAQSLRIAVRQVESLLNR